MMLGLSGDQMVDYLLYGAPKQETVSFFQKSLDRIMTAGSRVSQWAIDSSKQYFDRFYSNDAILSAQNFLRSTASQCRDDVIHVVTHDLYKPNLMTQQYIMACPEVWDLRLKGMSNDFGMKYYDLDPEEKDIGWRKDFAMVDQGMVHHLDDGCKITTYSFDDDREKISSEDQFTIQDNWRVVRSMLALGEDPTE